MSISFQRISDAYRHAPAWRPASKPTHYDQLARAVADGATVFVPMRRPGARERRNRCQRIRQALRLRGLRRVTVRLVEIDGRIGAVVFQTVDADADA